MTGAQGVVGLHWALVLGCGDVGSAIALTLWRAGFRVVLSDEPYNAQIRRGMSFTDAWFHGSAMLDSTTATFFERTQFAPQIFDSVDGIVATDLDTQSIAARTVLDVLVDARMRKRDPAPTLKGLARLTIGAGPGFIAQNHVEVVIETAWGEDLGMPKWHGSTRPYDGQPRVIAGHGKDRYVYLTDGGIFRTEARIGQTVVAGESVGTLNGQPCAAPLDGVLRGLAHDGAVVRAGKKVVEVDPSGNRANCFGVSPRGAQIAQGVLRAIRRSS